MPVARPESSDTRVIAHVDLDCFYVQVEQRKNPELRAKPTAVVQYNSWKGGGLIAVSYEARKCGVSRNMRGDEAKKVCADIHLIQVPVAHGKADLTQYRDAGSEVVAILARKGTCERASIDEVYLDITDASAALLAKGVPLLSSAVHEEVLRSHIVGYSDCDGERQSLVEQWIWNSEAEEKDRLLACGAIVIAELRSMVLEETTFTCSAGIAHNKMLAKLASGMHKPAQQTVVPSSSVYDLLASLPIKKMKQLGGKLGDSLMSDLNVTYVGDLLRFPESKLQDLYGVNTGTWLWNIARGLNGDEVKARVLPKSHSCGKTFSGPQALKSRDAVMYWLQELAAELQERLDVDFQQNNRTAHLLTLHAGTVQGYKPERKFPSKSCALRYGKQKIAEDALRLFERGLKESFEGIRESSRRKDETYGDNWSVTSLYIGASNIWATPFGMNPITHFFTNPSSFSTASCEAFSGVTSSSCVSHHLVPLDPAALGTDANINPNISLTEEDNVQDCVCSERATGIEGYEKEDSSNANGKEAEPSVQRVCHTAKDAQILVNSKGDWNCFNSEEPSEAHCDEKGGQLPLSNGIQGSLKLKDAWERTPKSNYTMWSYRQEDIDAAVLSELPSEIQEELYANFGLKKLRLTRKGTITDFFSFPSM